MGGTTGKLQLHSKEDKKDKKKLLWLSLNALQAAAAVVVCLSRKSKSLKSPRFLEGTVQISERTASCCSRRPVIGCPACDVTGCNHLMVRLHVSS